MKSIQIALFAYGGVIDETMDALLAEFQLAGQQGLEVEFTRARDDALISRSRSVVASQFHAGASDCLVMIDRDIVWPPGSLIGLAERAVEHSAIVAGIYPVRHPVVDRARFNIRFLDDSDLSSVRIGEKNACSKDCNLRPVRYVSAGFLAISRAALGLIINRNRELSLEVGLRPCVAEDGTPFFDLFRPLCIGLAGDAFEYLSEDYSFPVAPDTKILAADWRWRAVSDYAIGDTVMAIDEESPPHSARRFRIAGVKHVVKKSLPTWKIITDNGDLVTTSEHPWLVKRMWRSAHRGPHKGTKGRLLGPPMKWSWTPTDQIKPGDCLARVVPFTPNANTESDDYINGYLQGIMHSDGCLTRVHGEPNRRFVLYMCDKEAVDRTEKFLQLTGLRTKRAGLRTTENPVHRQLYGVNVNYRADVARLASLRAYDGIPSDNFAAGYLAAMYDGDGTNNGGFVAIIRHDPYRKQRVIDSGKTLGLNFTQNAKQATLCGADNMHSFWMQTQPSIRRKVFPKGQKGNDGITRMREAPHKPVRVLAIEKLKKRDDVLCLVTSEGTMIAQGIATHNCSRANMAQVPVLVWTQPRLVHFGRFGYTLEGGS